MELQPDTGPREPRLFLRGSGLSLAAGALRTRPNLCAFAAEDAAWIFEQADWASRRPPAWARRRRRQWRHDGEVLEWRRRLLRLQAERICRQI